MGQDFSGERDSTITYRSAVALAKKLLGGKYVAASTLQPHDAGYHARQRVDKGRWKVADAMGNRGKEEGGERPGVDVAEGVRMQVRVQESEMWV